MTLSTQFSNGQLTKRVTQSSQLSILERIHGAINSRFLENRLPRVLALTNVAIIYLGLRSNNDFLAGVGNRRLS